MTKVYSRCYDEIGTFNDTRYIVGMLEKVNITQSTWRGEGWVEGSTGLSSFLGFRNNDKQGESFVMYSSLNAFERVHPKMSVGTNMFCDECNLLKI